MKYDIIVIWAGSWGLTTSIWLANAWKKVALIERWEMWWDCTNSWCVPSKAFIDIAKKWEIKNFKDIFEEIRKRRQEIRNEETPDIISKYWIDVILWTAKFTWKNSILVDWKKLISAKKIIISTGSSAMRIKIEWLNKKDLLTNEEVFELKDEIKDLVIIWWWYIWSELSEAFANIWVNISLIQRNENLIPREEWESSDVLKKEFEKKWIKVFTNSIIKKADWKNLILTDKNWENERKIKFDKVLIALWRKANFQNLELEKAWIKFDKRWIITNEKSVTSNKNIFAIWDCVSWNPQFTHWANAQWRSVIKNILIPNFLWFLKSWPNLKTLPAVLYTNIEVARVWKTESELLDIYDENEIISKITYFSENDRSKVTKDETWFVKINFKRLSWKILWATIVWKWAWEMLWVLVEAIENKVSAYKLSSQIFAYPTKSELIKKVADKFVIWTLSNLKNEIKFCLKNNFLQIITIFIWLILIFIFFSYKIQNNLNIEEIAINLYNFISWNPTIWPIIYILFYAIRPIVFFPATFMTFMSWALFWFWWGLAFTIIWENMSANFAYFLWRVFWKKLISPESSWWIIDTIRNEANKNAFISILMTRLLFFPFDLVNYISWFLKINWKWFFFATLIWIIPWASVFILAWSAFQNEQLNSFSDALKWIDITMLYYAGGLFILTIILAKILKKIRK